MMHVSLTDLIKTRLLSFEMQSKMMLGNAEIESSATFQRDGDEPLFISFVLDAVCLQRVRVACNGRDSHDYTGSGRLNLTKTKSKRSQRLLFCGFLDTCTVGCGLLRSPLLLELWCALLFRLCSTDDELSVDTKCLANKFPRSQ